MICKRIDHGPEMKPTLQCDADAALLCDFFETEVQDRAAVEEHILKGLESSALAQYEASGNLYTILFYKNKFELTHQFDEDIACSGSINEFLCILELWRETH
ncbi:hypothetical protein [Sneathiella aquimaris]|uniref:hypothetical protein n=1 Tax=Sneathiella aquimaris TaxID=2599305 RepID=UPI00146A413B|nr:hypothetical protein [Sneathiella aquimaris]